jgi:hypothetical protein
MRLVLLEPNHGHYDAKLIRRQYEGSSLEIGPDRVAWTPPAYRWCNHGGFAVPIGDQPGQAHAVTKVRTGFPSRFNSGLIDRYVVTDSTGALLGSFPSGEGISGSSLPQHLAGWYPAPAVMEAVVQSGLVWDDQDFVGDAPALEAAFPGAVPHLRNLHRMMWVQSVVYALGGVAFLSMATAWVIGEGWVRFVFPLMLYFLGLELLFVGVLASPPMLRRLRQRHLAKQPPLTTRGRS